MLAQVMGAVFSLMEEHVDLWKEVRTSEPVPLFGFQYEVGLEPIPVNVEHMLKAFKLGLNEFHPMWNGVLSKGALMDLQAVHPVPSEFKFPDELWVQVIYDFALAAHHKVMTWEHLLKSFTPLYLGRVAYFIFETKQSSHWEVEDKIEQLCLAFEKGKPYLVDRWEETSNLGGSS